MRTFIALLLLVEFWGSTCRSCCCLMLCEDGSFKEHVKHFYARLIWFSPAVSLIWHRFAGALKDTGSCNVLLHKSNESDQMSIRIEKFGVSRSSVKSGCCFSYSIVHVIIVWAVAKYVMTVFKKIMTSSGRSTPHPLLYLDSQWVPAGEALFHIPSFPLICQNITCKFPACS